MCSRKNFSIFFYCTSNTIIIFIKTKSIFNIIY
nr:MAG TPA: hypothetical protein [Caudoviricetes sp.]